MLEGIPFLLQALEETLVDQPLVDLEARRLLHNPHSETSSEMLQRCRPGLPCRRVETS
jgi:hypothetical protein